MAQDKTLIRVGRPPRGRRPVPYGWPERLTFIVWGLLVILLLRQVF